MTSQKDKKTPPSKPVYHGHRQRMYERFLYRGMTFFYFSPREMLEMMLFFTDKRQDTAPLANRLINHFGSLANTFSASAEELMKIKGIGPTKAVKLRFYSSLMDYLDNQEDDG